MRGAANKQAAASDLNSTPMEDAEDENDVNTNQETD
jgi:hypothetical protein